MWMVEGRGEDQWNHTSALLSMIHNRSITKQSDAMTPAQFNPFHKASKKRLKGMPITKETFGLLKGLIKK
jgi:hypothetical protein